MSNLTNNTTKLNNLLEKVNALPDAGMESGEDVTDETNAYTTKLTSLETAITALETELAGKTSGGNGVDVGTCTLVISEPYTGLITSLCYQESIGSSVMILADPLTSAAGTYTAAVGTLLCVRHQSSTENVLTTNIEQLSGDMYLITAKAGETATLSVSTSTN